MNIYDSTAETLRYGSAVAVAITAIGLVLNLMDISIGADVIWFGVLVLILSPLFGVIVAGISLAMNKEWNWVAVSGVLLAVISAGSVCSWLL